MANSFPFSTAVGIDPQLAQQVYQAQMLQQQHQQQYQPLQYRVGRSPMDQISRELRTPELQPAQLYTPFENNKPKISGPLPGRLIPLRVKKTQVLAGRSQAHGMDCVPGVLYSLGLINEAAFHKFAMENPHGVNTDLLLQIGKALQNQASDLSTNKLFFFDEKFYIESMKPPNQFELQTKIARIVDTVKRANAFAFLLLIECKDGKHCTIITKVGENIAIYETQGLKTELSTLENYINSFTSYFGPLKNINLLTYHSSLEADIAMLEITPREELLSGSSRRKSKKTKKNKKIKKLKELKFTLQKKDMNGTVLEETKL